MAITIGTMIHGREPELARLTAVADAARAGRTETLVIAGEVGIGKTALLDTVTRNPAGLRVLRTTGTAAETHIGFVGLLDVLTPILDHRLRLPSPQRQAIERALVVNRTPSESEGDGRLAVRVATLALLAAAAEESAVLVVVDDAQWVDQESLDTLIFAARRLASDRIGFLFAVRTPAGAPPSSGQPLPSLAEFPLLQLSGLPSEASEALLTSVAPQLVEPLVRATVLATAAGNPLALQEIPRLLSADLTTHEALTQPLPVGEAIQQSVGNRLAGLNERTRLALTVAAASGKSHWADVPAALAELGLSPEDLNRAEQNGLVRLGADPTFRHPLVRAAVYHGSPVGDRRAAHRALANTVTGHRAIEIRAGHLAAAATGPDPVVAEALAKAGEAARDQGAWQTAMNAFRRAAQFTTDPDRRTAHLVAAAQAALLTSAPEAAELATAAAQSTRNPLARARAHRVLAALWHIGGNARRATRMLVTNADRVEPFDNEFGMLLRLDATACALHCGDYELADAVARTAVERADAVDDDLRLAAQIACGWVRFCRAEADPREPFGVPLAEVTSRIPHGPGVLPFATLALPWLEYYDQARVVLDRLLTLHDGDIPPDLLTFSQNVDADLAFRTGQWVTGAATAAEAARLAGDLGHRNIQAKALTLLAQYDAAAGRDGECKRHVAQAVEIARSSGLAPVEVFGAAALGLLASGLRDYETVVAQLGLVRRSLERDGVRHPGIISWAPDLIEALHRVGDTTAAEQLLLQYEELVARTRYRTGEISIARCRLILGQADERLSRDVEKLGYDSPVSAPFEQARLLLAYGEFLRLSGQRAAARRPLRDADLIFTRLGAAPWAQRAAAALRAAGGRAVTIGDSPVNQLSPQELQVVRQVVRGARNREAATTLFLSPKTIEGHLSSIYRKLGIRSRAELIARFAGTELQ